MAQERVPGAGSEEIGTTREGAGKGFSDHQRRERDLQAMAEARLPVHHPLLLGHAHLGGIQGILGDVVLQGSTVAVASRPECQAPGGAHSAFFLNIIKALQDLWGGGGGPTDKLRVLCPTLCGTPACPPALQESSSSPPAARLAPHTEHSATALQSSHQPWDILEKMCLERHWPMKI